MHFFHYSTFHECIEFLFAGHETNATEFQGGWGIKSSQCNNNANHNKNVRIALSRISTTKQKKITNWIKLSLVIYNSVTVVIQLQTVIYKKKKELNLL